MDRSSTPPGNASAGDADLPIGSVIGRYRLSALLGQGGMGRVWKARDELLGRDVAIKELAPGRLNSAELGDLRERAIREARAVAQIDHANIVRIFDVVEHRGTPWIVMELVRGRSLFDLLHDTGPMRPRRVAAIGLDMLGALKAAHQAGVLHRDVKPANVLVGDDGRVVLTDFGVAVSVGDSAMTHTGVMLGSPSYMAPERARDQPASAASDLWSLGATLFAAVEGGPPFERSTPMATLAALMVDPPATAEKAEALGPALEALLQKDPARRANADRAAELLRAALAPEPSGRTSTHVLSDVPRERPVHPPPRRRRRSAIIAAVCAAAAVASAAAFAAQRDPQRSPALPAAVPAPASSDVRSPGPRPAGPQSGVPELAASSSAPTVKRSRPAPSSGVRTSSSARPVVPNLRVTFEAEAYTDNLGTENSFPLEASGGTVVGHTDNGDHVGYRNRSLAGVRRVTLRYSAGAGDTDIELLAGSSTGRRLALTRLRQTASWQTYATVTVALSGSASGPLFITFLGPKGSDIDTITYTS